MTTTPTQHFVVLAMTTTEILGGVTVHCYTNNPAHLWLRWTDILPQKHIIAREQRGALVNTYIDQCFVAFHDLEQLEPGDTTSHTFILENFTYCQTRWWYFWATIAGQLSPSATCIFQYHSKSLARYCYNLPAGDHLPARSACAVTSFPFRPAASYTLTHWKTHLSRYFASPPQDTFELFIFSATADAMPLLLLGQGSITAITLPPWPAWLDVDFPISPTPLTQGANYAIGWRVSNDYHRDGPSNRISQDGGLDGNCQWPPPLSPCYTTYPGWQPDGHCNTPADLALWDPNPTGGVQYFETFGLPTPP